MVVFWIVIASSYATSQDYALGSITSIQGFTMASGGNSVSTAGDINGDGVSDVIIGNSLVNSNTGVTYVVFGSRDASIANFDLATFTTGPTTGFRILAATFAGNSGRSVSCAGDVNGDGVDDVIVGSWATAVFVKTNAGISYVIFGRKVTSPANAFTDIQLPTTTMAAGVGFRILGALSHDYSGWSVSNAGDFNHDGIDDVIVGAYSADPPSLAPASNAGMAYVVFGKNMTGSALAFGDVDLASIGPSSTIGFRILGAAAADRFGFSVSAAGDVNGDGISDIIVGADVADPPNLIAGSNAGISYVIYGRAYPLGTSWSEYQVTTSAMGSNKGFRILGATVNDQSGFAVSSAGNISCLRINLPSFTF